MDAPVSNFVYSSFAFFGTVRSGELPGLWFVYALAEVGCDESAVRRTLHRMEGAGELTSRREGREKFYAPTGYAKGEIKAGSQKIFDAPKPWDGRWTLIHARFDGAQRIHRDRLHTLLDVEGFASMAPGLYLHPRPLGKRILQAADPVVREQIFIVRGKRLGRESDGAFIARHWDLPALARRYGETLADLRQLRGRAEKGVADREAFRCRFEVVIRFLRVAWDDPDLPTDLLPAPWPGTAAREMALELYTRFLPGARRFGDQVLERIGHGDAVPVGG